MVTLSLIKAAVAVGGLALSLTAGAGIASASPGLGPLINTTCDFWQIRAAMNAQSPQTAAQFMNSPAEQSWLHDFLASPPSIRQRMAANAQTSTTEQPYLRAIQQAATICIDY
jgi:hemophore-related protein